MDALPVELWWHSGHGDEAGAANRMLHQALSARLGVDAASLRWGRGPHGKPFLVGRGRHPRFSVTHTQAAAMVALTDQAAVGVDVECRRPIREMWRIADQWMSLHERTCMRDAGVDAASVFFRIWTAKEAALKALGLGLFALADVEVCVVRERARLRCSRQWNMACRIFEPSPGFTAACVVRSSRDIALSILPFKGTASSG